MSSRTPRCAGALIGLVACFFAGCESLSPTQLWKLNRHPRMDDGDAYFSVPSGKRPAANSGPRILPPDEVSTADAE